MQGFWILDFRLTPYLQVGARGQKFWILDYGVLPDILW
jgi:hypothetical protein